jgi:hypothetical protein
LLEAGVLPHNGFTYNHLYGTKAGGIIFDKDGHKHCAADLLEYANPIEIKVYLHATVYNILFRSNNGKDLIKYLFIYACLLALCDRHVIKISCAKHALEGI